MIDPGPQRVSGEALSRGGRFAAAVRGLRLQLAGQIAALQMLEDAADDLRIFDAGDDLDRPAALFAALDLDAEDAFEALRPVIAACVGTALPCTFA